MKLWKFHRKVFKQQNNNIIRGSGLITISGYITEKYLNKSHFPRVVGDINEI